LNKEEEKNQKDCKKIKIYRNKEINYNLLEQEEERKRKYWEE